MIFPPSLTGTRRILRFHGHIFVHLQSLPGGHGGFVAMVIEDGGSRLELCLYDTINSALPNGICVNDELIRERRADPDPNQLEDGLLPWQPLGVETPQAEVQRKRPPPSTGDLLFATMAREREEFLRRKKVKELELKKNNDSNVLPERTQGDGGSAEDDDGGVATAMGKKWHILRRMLVCYDGKY